MQIKTFTRTIITAKEGYVLTDGKTYGKKIILAEGADASVWHEITDEEHKAIMEEKRKAFLVSRGVSDAI